MDEIENFFKERNILVLHGFDTIDIKDEWRRTVENIDNRLSCFTITTEFRDDNFFSPFGIVILPRNILFISSKDAGFTRQDEGNIEFSKKIARFSDNPIRELTNAKLDSPHEDYNEIIVTDYEVIGTYSRENIMSQEFTINWVMSSLSRELSCWSFLDDNRIFCYSREQRSNFYHSNDKSN